MSDDPTADPLPNPRQPTRACVMLTLLALVGAYVLLASSSTLWDRDEPRFARCTVEMVGSGDYLVPTFNGDLRPDKPAGIYWLMSVGYKAFGLTEIAFRLPSILGISLAAFLTYLIGRRLFNDRVGHHAMIFYGSGLMVVYMATASTADGAMNGMITLAIWCFIEIIHGGRKLPLFILMTIALAVAQLVKGPVGVVIPLISMLLMGVLGARAGAFKTGVVVWSGVAVAVVASFGAFAAWGIPANIASDGELMKLGMGKHVGERAISPQENHGGAGLKYVLWLPFYLPVILFAMTPWVMHLPGGVVALIGKRIGEPRQRAVIWGYILPTLVMMTLVATKLPHYVLPIFPGLALLCAAVIDPIHAGQLSTRDKNCLRHGRFVVAIVLVGLAAGAIAVGWFAPGGEGMRLPGALLGLAILGFGGVQVYSLRKGNTERATRAPMVGLPIALLIACLLFLPALEDSIKPSKALADAIRAEGLAQSSVKFSGFNEPSLVFYLDRPFDQPIGLLGSEQAIADWAAEEGPGVLVIKSEWLGRVEEKVGKLDLVEIYASSAIQYSDGGEESKLLALSRNHKLDQSASDD